MDYSNCVIYLHGNSGNKISGKTLIQYLLPEGIPLLTFDFAGSGCSDGKYVTLGFNESNDLIEIIE